MIPTFSEYRADNYSQSGEDGIIEELLDRLGISDGWFCEFGAWDGKHYSNTYNLIDNGTDWHGVLIEADTERYEALQKMTANHSNRLYPINRSITATGENALDNVLTDTPIPKEFDLLSIDVDGPDYFIWKEFTSYTPAIVIIEYNPSLGPELRMISELTPDTWLTINQQMVNSIDALPVERRGERIRLMGSSFSSIVNLGYEKGYVPVSCTQNNVILVVEEYIDQLGLSAQELDDPTVLYEDEFLPSEFYEDSPADNIRKVRASIENNGFTETTRLILSKLKRGLR
jgi:hypothetical protein